MKLQSTENNNMENENPTEALTKSQSETNNNEDGNLKEISTKDQSSRKRTPKSLRAKSKAIKKSSASSSLKSKKAKSSPKFEGENRKNKNHLQGNEESRKNEFGDANNRNSNEKNISNKERIEKGQEIRKNQERFSGSSKGQKNKKREEKHGGSDKSLRNQKNKGKLDGKEKNEQDERKKEKLGGMIFMCSAKTKPDCFRYRVMGVPMNKKELILGLKPGLKLFLYDFDLKLMYGIYEASSSGGVKLEPKAFGGSFPVQVRFTVHKDCYPITESVFKKAMKDNYNENNRFKTELTVRQVWKLSALFRPVTAPIRSPPTVTVRDREVYAGARELLVHSDREAFTRANHDARSYPVLSDERDRHVEYSGVGSTQRDEIPRDLFMSEKDYRTYGLSGERRNLTPLHISSALDPYLRHQEREHLLRKLDPIYRDRVPLQREAVLFDPIYLNQAYNPGGVPELLPATTSMTGTATASGSARTALDSYTRDPYYTYSYGGSSADAYLPPPRRDEVSSGSYYVDGPRETYLFEADPLRRKETGQVDRLYSTYAADASSNYNQMIQHHIAKPEIAPPAVSSRYTFAGPSISHR